jgi:hypothetical protein
MYLEDYVRIDDALRTMVARYDINDSMTYLASIARILNINVI